MGGPKFRPPFFVDIPEYGRRDLVVARPAIPDVTARSPAGGETGTEYDPHRPAASKTSATPFR
jgi:hypothetical protein